MKTGEELLLIAARKEHKRLLASSRRAEAEYEEYMGVAHEMISINEEVKAIIDNKEYQNKEVLTKLDKLKKRSAKCNRIRKKDLSKLIEKKHTAMINSQALASEIAILEMRFDRRR